MKAGGVRHKLFGRPARVVCRPDIALCIHCLAEHDRAGVPDQLIFNNQFMSTPSKQRLLVMNGQRLVQSEHAGGQWTTDKVEKAGLVKPGIYNIHLAARADKSQSHDGLIIYNDKDHVYQQVGKNFVMHDRENFDKVPEIGSTSNIKYEGGRAQVALLSGKLVRGMSR